MRRTMTKARERQLMIEEWKRATGAVEIDMDQVAEYALSKGWPAPRPKTAAQLLSEQFAQAARETMRYDDSGQPYRAYHPVEGGQGKFDWYDIEEIDRPRMQKSTTARREQTVGDVLQMVLDLDHWNSMHTDEAPIVVETDFTFDVQIRKHAPKMISEATSEPSSI